MFASVPHDVAEEFGVALLALGEAIATQVRFLPQAVEVNHALGVATAAELDELAGFYGTRRHAVSTARGVDLDAALRGRGYEPGPAWMKFSRKPGGVRYRSTDIGVVEVGQDEDADFGRTVCEGFGMPTLFAHWLARLPGRPGWHCFVSYLDRAPAAGGALYVHEDVGWLGLGATRSEFRRRGAQSAILEARIARAAELSCSLVVTETGELAQDRPSTSYRNILRAGFEPCYLRANWVPKALI